MKIKQIITQGTTVFIFTDNPEEDIKEYIKNYKDEEYSGIELGYEIPVIDTYKFLGKEYPVISLWFDNEDVPDFYTKLIN